MAYKLNELEAHTINCDGSLAVDTINGKTKGNAIMRQNASTGNVLLGSNAQKLVLTGNETRPRYTTGDPTASASNMAELALKSDIPFTISSNQTVSANDIILNDKKLYVDGFSNIIDEDGDTPYDIFTQGHIYRHDIIIDGQTYNFQSEGTVYFTIFSNSRDALNTTSKVFNAMKAGVLYNANYDSQEGIGVGYACRFSGSSQITIKMIFDVDRMGTDTIIINGVSDTITQLI